MSFTYDWTNNPTIAAIRLMVSDTVAATAVWQDEDINGAASIEQQTWTSSMLYSGTGNQPLPSFPASPTRVAARLLDSYAALLARKAAVEQVLDVKLSCAAAAKEMREQAKELRSVEENCASFAVAEMVNTQFAARERVWKQFVRQYGGVGGIV